MTILESVNKLSLKSLLLTFFMKYSFDSRSPKFVRDYIKWVRLKHKAMEGISDTDGSIRHKISIFKYLIQ